MTNSIPAPGEFYRHFKNKYYQILAIAKHSETKEQMVVYQALYDDFGIYVRPLDMFISEVDHEKYPEVKQLFRFEKVTAQEVSRIPGGVEKNDSGKDNVTKSIPKASVDDEHSPSPILMEFLDLRTMTEKSKFLSEHKKNLTDDMINAMAASLDVTVDDGPLELRYSSLRSCLQTKAKYEINRLRN